jgi:hypothetical protein
MEIKDKNMKYARKKFNHNFILITYEIINMKWNEQGYGSRSYIRLMLNKLTVMGT